MVKQVVFTAHAEVLQILRKHGFKVFKEDIVDAVKNPKDWFPAAGEDLLHIKLRRETPDEKYI
ncbi:MAG: hypothetical protein ACP5PQ_06050 [Thermoproteota archaeon]